MIYIETIEEYDKLIFNIEDVDYDTVEIDFETTGLDIRTLVPILLGIKYGDDEIIINLLKIKDISKLLGIFVDKLWIAHNAKFEYSILKYHYKFELEKIWCTQVCSQILTNGTDLKNSYDVCLERSFNIKLDKSVRNSFINRNLDLPITEAEKEYLLQDIRHLKRLKERQQHLGNSNLLSYCFDLENKFIPVLAEMEMEGIKINTDKWNENTENYKKEAVNQVQLAKEELLKLDNDFPNLLKEKFLSNKNKEDKEKNQLVLFDKFEFTNKQLIIDGFNIGSSTQVKEIFKRCYLNLESTDEPSLESFVLNNRNHKLIPFVKHLLGTREYNKLISTYGNNFLRYIHPITNRVHGNFGQVFTDTGRLNCTNPNLLNIDKRPEIRSCFIPDSEDYVFMCIDYDGQELRIASSYSQDKILLSSFNEGLDLHSYLAQASHRIIEDNDEFIVSKKVNGNLRNAHKPVLFGYIFGGGVNRIAGVLNIAIATSKKVYAKLKDNLKTLTIYQNQIKQKVVREKQIRCGSYINRIRYFNFHVETNLEDYDIEKQGVNFPIQSTAASMMKEAMLEVTSYFKANNHTDCKIKLQIYDELIIQIPKKKIYTIKYPYIEQEIKTIMEEVGTKFLTGLKMETEAKIENYWTK